MTARLAEAKVCRSGTCSTVRLLVRGDRISFVSVEQARKVGCKKGACPMERNDTAMPSDITCPTGFVLVHDPSGQHLDPCHFFVVRWSGKGLSSNPEDVDDAARDYFGASATIRTGSVEIPKGPWKRSTRVRFIRYRRHGFERGFEHEYAAPVWLHVCRRPLAWKLVLPSGCVVNAHGFVVP